MYIIHSFPQQTVDMCFPWSVMPLTNWIWRGPLISYRVQSEGILLQSHWVSFWLNTEIESLTSKILVFLHSKFLLASFRNVKTGFQNSHFPLNFLVELGTQMSFIWHLGCLDVGFAPVLSAPTWSSVLVTCEEREEVWVDVPRAVIPEPCSLRLHVQTPGSRSHESTHVLALFVMVQTSWLPSVPWVSILEFSSIPHPHRSHS